MALTGFLLFCNANRNRIRDQLAGNSPGHKISLGAIQKALSSEWKNLSESERQTYLSEAAVKEKPEVDKRANAALSLSKSTTAYGNSFLRFPNHQISKILKLDQSIKKIPISVTNAINIASMLFLIKLVSDCSHKSKTEINQADIASAIKKGGVRMNFLKGCLHLLDNSNPQASSNIAKNNKVYPEIRSDQQVLYKNDDEENLDTNLNKTPKNKHNSKDHKTPFKLISKLKPHQKPLCSRQRKNSIESYFKKWNGM